MGSKKNALTADEIAIIEEEKLLLATTQSALTIQALPEGQLDLHADIIELRDSISDSRTEDLPAIISHMERLVLLARQQNKVTSELPVNRLNPYFAHIRLAELGRTRDLLIGNQNSTLEHLKYPIIDWKHAPLSQIYYRYQEGEEFSEDIGDAQIEGELLLRRTISIENGELTRIDTRSCSLILTDDGWARWDRQTSILQGGSGTASRALTIGRSGSGLGNRAYRKDKHLQEITALIDPEQFEIITRPESGVVVIQGGAGSGKTTIALHRLAYLLALKPQYYIPHHVITVVFNKALSRYISKVLPALGAENTKSWVYQEWTEQFRRRYFTDLPNHYSERTPLSVIEVKRHPIMLQWIKEEVQAFEKQFFDKLESALPDLPEKEHALKAWIALSNWPLVRQVVLFLNWASGRESIPRIPQCETYSIKIRIISLVEDIFPDIENNPANLAITIWEECFIHEDRLINTFQRLAPGAFSESKLKEVQQWSVQHYRKRHEDEFIDKELLEGLPLEQNEIDEEDDTILLLLYQLTIGPFRRKKNKRIIHPHIMIDEAQDFSPVELQLLINTTPDHRRSVTLAGDFDQQIMTGSSIGNWSELLDTLGIDGTAISPLKIGYRSTHEIMEVARSIIGPDSVNQEWKAVRHGAPVELFRMQNQGRLINLLSEALIQVIIQEPSANVAILTRYAGQADVIYEGLLKADVPKIKRVREQDFTFEPGIEICDIFQVKGLEFDYVVLVDVDEQTFPLDDKARHLLYVGVTRAAHQLWIMTCRDSSPLLPIDLLQESH